VAPASTVTVPVGVPPNCGVTGAVKTRADSRPKVTVFTESESAVVVVAVFTVRLLDGEGEPVKLPSPL